MTRGIFTGISYRGMTAGKLREQGAEAMKRGDYTGATECMRQAEAMEALPRIAPHWEDGFICHVCGPVNDILPCCEKGHDIMTEGEYFATLDVDGRRDELAQNWIVSAHRDGDGEIALSLGPKHLQRP
jgi:hypothetical protein